MFKLPETEQEVFDIVAKHLITQNRRSNSNGICMYRSPEGLKCAAGCLIPDDAYCPSMENVVWSALACINRLVPKQHMVLISQLQLIHDTEPPEKWIVKLRELAVRECLNTLVLDNTPSE